MPELMRPILLTAMSDVFSQGDSSAVYFFEMVAGTIERISHGGDLFHRLLTNESFVTERMLPDS